MSSSVCGMVETKEGFGWGGCLWMFWGLATERGIAIPPEAKAQRYLSGEMYWDCDSQTKPISKQGPEQKAVPLPNVNPHKNVGLLL